MAEEIKVVLAADASQLTSEFKKAQATAAEFSSRTLPLVSQELDRTFMESQKLRKGLPHLQRGFGNSGNSMLVFAQAADDAQYGMRGLSNQIPQLAQAIGLGGGLAGAIGIAAVAVTVLLPLLKRLYADEDLAKIKAVGDARAKRYETELEALRKLEAEKGIREEVDRLTRDIGSYAERELMVQDQRLRILDQQAASLRTQRTLQDEIARERAAVATAGVTGGGSAAEEARQKIVMAAAEAARAAEAKRMGEDIARARMDARLSGEEYNRVRQEAENIRSAYTSRVQVAEEEIARLRGNLASSEAAVAGFEEGVKQGLPGSTTNLRRSTSRRDADQAELAKQQQLLEALRQQAAAADAAAKATLDGLSARIDAAERERRTIEDSAAARKELDDLKAQRERLEAQKEITAARKQEADEAARAAEQTQREAEARAKDADRKAQESAAINLRRGDFAAETRIMELRAQGQEKLAAALEKEAMLRQESRQIAEQLGITEAQGLELARRRQRILDFGESRNNRPTSRIGGDRPNGGLRIGGLETSRGLRTSTLDREAASRTNPDNSLAAKAASYYERSLQNEESLLKIFNKLGIY